MNYRFWLIIGSVFMFTAVLLGAFGAHGLQNIVSIHSVNSFKTGVTYQFYHAFSILCLVALQRYLDKKYILYALRIIFIGTLLFSGSIYFITLFKIMSGSDIIYKDFFYKVLIFLTPLGGLFFLAGWFFVLLSAIKKSKGERL